MMQLPKEVVEVAVYQKGAMLRAGRACCNGSDYRPVEGALPEKVVNAVHHQSAELHDVAFH